MAEASFKLIDLLNDTFRETAKAVDTSLFLAFVAALFVIVHGIQADYRADVEAQVHAARQAVADTAAALLPRPVQSPTSGKVASASRRRVDIPAIGLEAELLTAALIAIVLYWVLCARALLLALRGFSVAKRLVEYDTQVFNITSWWPCLLTAGLWLKVTVVAILGGMGFLGWMLFTGQVQGALHIDGSGAWVSGGLVVAPTLALIAAFLRWPPKRD